jgi:two-component sensor histidine kinase
MKFNLILFLIFIFVSIGCGAFSQSNDQLKDLCDEAMKLRYSNIPKALELISKVQQLTEKNAEIDTFYAEALRIKGNIVKGNNPDSALFLLRKSLNSFKKGKSLRGEVRTLLNIALIETNLGHYETSHKIYNSVDLLAKQMKNEVLELQNLINWVQNFNSKKDFKSAIKYNDRARDLNSKLGKNFEAYIYGNYAKIHMDLRNYDTAIKHYENARKFLKYDRNLIPIFHSISNCYHNLGDLTNTMRYIDSLKQFDLEADDLIRIQDQLINIAIKSKNRVEFETNLNIYDSLFTILNEAQFDCMVVNYQAIFEHEIKNIAKFKEKAYLAFDCLKAKKSYDFAADMAKRTISVSLSEKDRDLFDFLTHYQDSISKSGIYKVIRKSELELYNEINEIENEKEKYELEKMLSEKKYADMEIKYKSNLNIVLVIFSLMTLGALIFILFMLKLLKNKNNDLIKQKSTIQLLHQELNHRVKNNLYFMTSLLEMQSRRTQNAEAREIIQETENRLGALSLVHSNLFKNDDTTTVNLANYLEELVSQLEKIFAIPDKELNFICHFTDHHVNAEDAMRLGLIVNELVTNSVKHAFSKVNEPQINIATKLDKMGKLTLEYKDNGPGHTHISDLKSEEINAHLGTKLIALLREQLKDRYVVIC